MKFNLFTLLVQVKVKNHGFLEKMLKPLMQKSANFMSSVTISKVVQKSPIYILSWSIISSSNGINVAGSRDLSRFPRIFYLG